MHYLSCSTKKGPDKYKCYCEIEVLDAQEKQDEAFEQYISNLSNNKQYQDIIDTWEKENKYYSKASTISSIKNSNLQKQIVDAYYNLIIDESTSLETTRKYISKLQRVNYYNTNTKEINEALDKKTYIDTINKIGKLNSYDENYDCLSELEFLYWGGNSGLYKEDKELYNNILKEYHYYQKSWFEDGQANGYLHTWEISSVLSFSSADDYIENYYTPLKDAYPSLAEDPLYDYYRLYGSWGGDGYYFKMEKNEDNHTNYDLPWPSGNFDYYNIKNHIFYMYVEGENGEELNVTNFFRFTFNNDGSLTVFCYKNNNTYTLYKK